MRKMTPTRRANLIVACQAQRRALDDLIDATEAFAEEIDTPDHPAYQETVTRQLEQLRAERADIAETLAYLGDTT